MASNGWEAFETFDDEASAEVLAGRLRVDGVPAAVQRESPIPGIAEFRVVVPTSLVHRARSVMAQAPGSDAELKYLATGELGDDHGVEIRRAQIADAPEMTRLSRQLGYPMPAEEMARRLGHLLGVDQHFVAVAVSGSVRLLGWMHVEHRFSIEGERAELMGLVVDTTARRRGAGRALVDEAERWARERGLSVLSVRSNVVRESSHPFYEALGFACEKTQHVYRKTIGSAPIARR